MNFSSVDALLRQQVSASAFPGAAAVIGDASGILHHVVVGAQTYDSGGTPLSVDSTYFDVASLTKVTVTTTAAMLLYQWGALGLQTRVSELLGPAFASKDARKEQITVEHLMLHEAGFPPDPTPVSYCAPSFACPETIAKPPAQRGLTFSCQSHAYDQLLAQPLDRAPGLKFVYSDLSMITMMHVIGHIVREQALIGKGALLPACVDSVASPAITACYYEAFARQYIFPRVSPAPAGGAATRAPRHASFMGFRLPRRLWPMAAPTWNDTADGFPGECVAPFRERLLHGEVSDGNAYALGGVAGHAGLFATASQLFSLAHQLLTAPGRGGSLAAVASPPPPLGVNATTVARFTAVHNASMSSRALGWDTQAGAHSLGLCGDMSARTFTHTGYTGTQICVDVDAGLVTVLLTNRVFPRADERSAKAIHQARILFNNAVLRAVHPDAERSTSPR